MVFEKSEDAVSEILGTLLLLSITVGIFGLVYVNVLNYNFPESKPATQLVTSIEDDLFVVEHIGGNELTTDSRIYLEINGTKMNFTAKMFMDPTDAADDKWSIGEQVIYPTGSSLTTKQVQAYIIDETTQFMYSTGLLIQ